MYYSPQASTHGSRMCLACDDLEHVAVVPSGCDGVDASDGISVPEWWCWRPRKEAFVNQVSTVGLDLAKYVFQAHGADASGSVVFRKKLRRHQVLSFFAALPPCTVAMEACAGAPLRGPGDR